MTLFDIWPPQSVDRMHACGLGPPTSSPSVRSLSWDGNVNVVVCVKQVPDSWAEKQLSLWIGLLIDSRPMRF